MCHTTRYIMNCWNYNERPNLFTTHSSVITFLIHIIFYRRDIDSESVKKVPLDEMWLTIGGYGMKRSILEASNPTEEDIAHLYHLIKKERHHKKEQEFIRLLKEHVEKITKP